MASTHWWFIGITQCLPGLEPILALHVHQDLESSAVDALGEQVEEHSRQFLSCVTHIDHGQLVLRGGILSSFQHASVSTVK